MNVKNNLSGASLSDAPKKNMLFYLKIDRQYILLCLPAILLLFIFCYVPMYGLIMAFTDFSIRKGIVGSPWVGLKWFEQFFHSFFFARTLTNTLALSFFSIIIGFPVPIIFALMLNEVKDGLFKRSVQTVSYMPHFISTVIVVGLMYNMFSPVTGVVNHALVSLGILDKGINFFYEPGWFRALYIGSDIWQNFGWNSIIYLASLTSIDPQLYEAAKIDGANRWKQLWKITLPCITPTIITLLILSFGSLMSVGFEKVFLMYNPATYETADVISTYTYRAGIVGMNFGYGTAVGLFNSVVNLVLLIIFNSICRRVSEVSLW